MNRRQFLGIAGLTMGRSSVLAYDGLDLARVDSLCSREFAIITPASFPHDPVAYAHRILGVDHLWEEQAKALRALLKDPYRVLMPSAHGTGKTFLAAVAVNWWYDSFPIGVSISTAPDHRSVCDLLWSEIRLQRQRAGLPGLMPAAPEMKTGPDHYAKGFTALSGNSFQGRHPNRLLIVFDEAAGVNPVFWQTCETMFHRRPGFAWLAILNPTDTGCQAFAEDQLVDDEGKPKWQRFSLDALEHPNVKGRTKSDPPIIPNAVSWQQVNEWVHAWCDAVPTSEANPAQDLEWPAGSGKWWRQGPIFLARCRGRWPTGQAFSVWSDSLWAQCIHLVLPCPLDVLPEIGCFVAGTMISTDVGQVPIERIKVGDRVLTRQGYKKVKTLHDNGLHPTVTVTCEDGRALTGTGNHPIWNGDGWSPLDSLTNHDNVFAWKPSNMTASFGIASQKPSASGRGTITEATFPGRATRRGGRATRCTAMSGKSTTGKFPQECAFTTRTRTRRTTTSPTWSFSRGRLTVHATPPTYGSQELASAKHAGRNTDTSRSRLGSVQIGASANGAGPTESTKFPADAASAARASAARSTNRPQLAPVRVRTKSHGKLERVYNLTVEDCPEYFANGILVHNCDVARFGDDFTAVHVRWANTSLYHDARNGWGTMQIASWLKEVAERWAAEATSRRPKESKPIEWTQIPIKIDDDGVGGGVVDVLQSWGAFVVPVGAGTRSISGRYPNRRSELWFQVADRATGGHVALGKLPSATLGRMRAQALAVQYQVAASGQRVCEPKEITKEKIGRSPDDMDAMNLAYLEGYEFEHAEFIEGNQKHLYPSDPAAPQQIERPKEKRRIW